MGDCCVGFRVNKLFVDKMFRVDNYREHIVEDGVAIVFRFRPACSASAEDACKQFIDQGEPIAFVGPEGLNRTRGRIKHDLRVVCGLPCSVDQDAIRQ